MALILAATVAPALAVTGVAGAIEPSVTLPEIKPVPAQEQTRKSRDVDEATLRAMTGDQGFRDVKAGANTPTATSLSPSAAWDVSAHTGDFTWSYPLRVPPAPGGLAPELALSYRSSAVDGRTSVTNNQPSWVGDGWDVWPGFIERTYSSCVDDDVVPQTGDLCWRSDNATAASDGAGGMLICCDGDKRWRAKNDDGARIERLPGAPNGDKGSDAADTGEHWRITTVDGTQYWFGSQGDAQSTWTVPVFGDDAGEPCHGTTFATSHCVQAWRWNLDKVVDRNGNVIRYFYEAESNRYGMNLKDAGVEYVRGGVLKRIDYGLHERIPGRATAQVEFTPADRCVPGSVCVADRKYKDNWPDAALEDKCDTPTCADRYSPTFWSTKRLASITTKVWRGSAYDEVDRWTLDQSFPDPGDGSKAALWLKGIKHTGLAGDGPADELPPVTFEGTQMPNRVYTPTDGYAPLVRYRITGVISESGGVISVNYASQCRPDHKPANAWTNSMWCFPVTWAAPGHKERTDYFHKYVVDKVIQSDWLSTASEQVTSYEYLDGAAWHWDTSEFVKESKKTWNEFRGFTRVRIRQGTEGDPAGPRTMSEQRFYRGMHGDKQPNNGTRHAQVSYSDGRLMDDHDWLRGFAFESTTFEREAPSTAAAPPFVSREITEPSWHGPTATRGAFKAYLVRAGTQHASTALKSGGVRETRTETRFDYDDNQPVKIGLPVQVNDLGDKATANDDRCTRTTYARNLTTWLLDQPAEVETVAVNCATTPRFPDNAISASRFGYDDRGNLNRTEVAKDRPAAKPVYVVTATASHDEHGRVTESKDALGAATRIEFTPRTGGPVTAARTTGPPTDAVPAGLVTTTTVDPAFGLPTKVVDANEQVTETAHDALGRISKVWLPNRPRLGDPPNPRGSAEFSYLIRREGPAVVTTTRVGPNGVHTSSNTLFDGLLRPRQVQTPAVGGGRLIVDTRYDSHGRAFKTTQPYFNDAAVDTNLWGAADTAVAGLTRTRFDGAGRPVESIYQAGATDKWKTITSYDGDRVHTTPPAGGTATTVLTDARGQTTELRQYRAPTPAGDYDSTAYRYTPAGQLAEVTGPDGALWKFRYDLRGRKITAEDPDAGISTRGYDDADRLTSVTDARGVTLAYAYDAMGRKTALHKDNLSGPKLAQWTYDTATNGKGLGASATRFVGGHAYTATADSYTALGKPQQTSVTIPAVEGPLAGTYTTYFGYGKDGSLTGERHPAAGDLPEETVNYGLDDWARPQTTKTAAGVRLVASTLYTRYGEVERLEHGVTPQRAWQSLLYETDTRRLQRSVVDAEVPAPMQQDLHYTYDQVGTITSIADLTLDQPTDVQCFRHDHLRRLTEAWTPTNATGCGAAPTQNALAGPAPYWHSYTFDKGGNRRTETQRTSTTASTRTYTYPSTGQPHTLRSVTGPGGTETYEYNPAGAMTRRIKPGADEIFTWDLEGHLESVKNTTTNQTTSFIYTTEGGRLLRKDSGGTTLYLGGQEVRLPAGSGDPVATRYYAHGGKTIAMRQGSTLTWLAGDHQGTALVAINTATLAVTRRRQLPYGAPRGATLIWPDERGFLGGPQDSTTGLTHLGAREYDPTIGRFISVDPIMDVADPQQMHGYAYSNSNPITFADPSGLIPGRSPDGGYSDDYGPGPTPPSPPSPRSPDGGYSGGGGRGGNTGGGRACGGRGYCGPNGVGPERPKPPRTMIGSTGYGVQRVPPSKCGSGQRYSSGTGTYGQPGCIAAGSSVDPHTALDWCGLLPVFGNVCDGLNALGYLIEGDPINAAISGLGMVEGIGQVATGARLATKNARNACSFDADTEVLMADGTTKPISEIKVGDKVLAADPETGEKGPRTVTAVLVHDDTVLELSTEAGGTVTTTEDHPFYNATDRAWERADQLDPGDSLLTATGEHTRIVGLLPTTAYIDLAYNLTVDDLHTYHVQVGDGAVLVHNYCGPDGLYYNEFPNDVARTPVVASPTRIRATSGEFPYVVTKDGRLVIGDSGRWGHFDLSGGAESVRAAGYVHVDKGRLVEINNASGHYKPHGWHGATEAEIAFYNAGFLDAFGKYDDSDLYY